MAEFEFDHDFAVVVGADFGGGPAPNDIEAEGERLMALVRQRLRGAEDLRLDRVTVGLRPIPEDGKPVIGFATNAPGVYLATMHSGVTLAPAVGRFASMEILDGSATEKPTEDNTWQARIHWCTLCQLTSTFTRSRRMNVHLKSSDLATRACL